MAASDIAATGMYAMKTKMETLTGNIANSKTIAYKAQEVEFKDTLYQMYQPAGMPLDDAGNITPVPFQVGTGVRVGSTYRHLAKGEAISTENPLDLYIDGPGYLKVTYPDDTYVYTQAGNFTLDDQRRIVTSEGYLVEDGFTIPEYTTDIYINRQGEIYARVDGEEDAQLVGNFSLTIFNNPRGLEAISENFYKETPASGDPVEGQPDEQGYGSILQKHIEASNVQLITQMTGIIDAQICYQACAEVIKKDNQRKEVDISLARNS
ncbi:MAG: flagellar hook-basal body protein [Alphaproteobacteria bacterium]